MEQVHHPLSSITRYLPAQHRLLWEALLAAYLLCIMTQAAPVQSLTWLGVMPEYIEASEAYGVSADDYVVVDYAVNGLWHSHAFRWTADSGKMQDLGTLVGADSRAYDVSADGFIVVGTTGWCAFRWTPTGGMEDLNQTYASLLTDGSYLTEANAISPDGRYIVGQGYNAATGRWEAYLLDTQGTTAVETEQPAASLALWVQPNPVQESARIGVQIPIAKQVRLMVTDLLGRTVLTLLDGLQPAGAHEVVWDGRSQSGARLAAGTYLLRLEASGQVQTQWLTLMP